MNTLDKIKLLDRIGTYVEFIHDEHSYEIKGLSHKHVILLRGTQHYYVAFKDFEKYYKPILHDGIYFASRKIKIKGQNRFIVFIKSGRVFFWGIRGLMSLPLPDGYTYVETSVTEILNTVKR